MFGYITPYKGELKVKEYEIFKGYYCGLCKSLGKEFNQLTRFGLNYDLNFLGLLLSSLDEKRDQMKMEGCFVNPLKKKKVIQTNYYLIYTSHISIILIYFKLIDDWKDDKSFKSLLATIPYLLPLKKSKRKYNHKYQTIKNCLERLSELEKRKCDVIDESADAFGKLMEEIAASDLIEDEETIRILKWLGYNLGRWIYILDAYNDIEEDVKADGYNPILLQYKYDKNSNIKVFKDRIKSEIEFSLTLTLDNIAKSFELLDIKHHRNILENIIYMGARYKMEQIFRTREAEHCEKSI
ncbi:MAG: cyclodeaminase/cyclohydrolase family protein [Firmicutes bacterium]|nr:cyclodeaminase/cyclohydrolase family protein [Bacillota bacterium]